MTSPSILSRIAEFLDESRDFRDLSASARHKLLERARMVLEECRVALQPQPAPEMPCESVVLIPMTKDEFRAVLTLTALGISSAACDLATSLTLMEPAQRVIRQLTPTRWNSFQDRAGKLAATAWPELRMRTHHSDFNFDPEEF